MSETKNYTFRTLNATDIAPMCKIISKIGIDEFTKVFESESVLKVIRNAKDKKAMTDMSEDARLILLAKAKKGQL